MTLDDFLAYFSPDDVRRTGQDRAVCRCPAHDDAHHSLSARTGERSVLVKCHAGCGFAEVAAALGIESSALSTRVAGGGSAEYVFVDRLWRPIAKKIRIDEADGKKRMIWYRWDSASQRYIKDLGEAKAELDRTLYRLPDLVRGVAMGMRVHLCEGEKACDRLRLAGHLATTPPGGGAQTESLNRDLLGVLAGAEVWIWADIDETGERWAPAACTVLRGLDCRVRIVQSATGLPHHDAWDHLEAGHPIEAAVHRPDLEPRRGNTRIPIESFAPVERRYLWEPYLSLGEMTLLDADGGVGKTSLILALAAGFSQGILPFGERTEPAKTLYYGYEDPGGTMRRLYEANGGVPGMMEVVEEPWQMDGPGLERFEEDLIDSGAKFVVLDALFYFLAGVVRDTNDWREVQPILRRLNEIVRRRGVALTSIRHTGKYTAGKGGTMSGAGLGSVQFRNSHRGQLYVELHPLEENQRVLHMTKGNLDTREGPSLLFERRGSTLYWVGPITPEELAAARRDVADREKPPARSRPRAKPAGPDPIERDEWWNQRDLD